MVKIQCRFSSTKLGKTQSDITKSVNLATLNDPNACLNPLSYLYLLYSFCCFLYMQFFFKFVKMKNLVSTCRCNIGNAISMTNVQKIPILQFDQFENLLIVHDMRLPRSRIVLISSVLKLFRFRIKNSHFCEIVFPSKHFNVNLVKSRVNLYLFSISL